MSATPATQPSATVTPVTGPQVLNGRMLKNTKIFGIFDFRFLSEVTFLLLNETFSMDDHIFEEDEKGTKMYFITKGTVVIM